MKGSRGFSLIELLIVVAIIGIIAAIAIPNLVRSKDAANEASALSSVRTIVTAEITYASTTGGGDFGELADLQTAGLIDEALAGGAKDNYAFAVATGGSTSFSVTADPQGGNAASMRGFYADQTGVIRWKLGGGATAEDPPISGSMHGGGE